MEVVMEYFVILVGAHWCESLQIFSSPIERRV